MPHNPFKIQQACRILLNGGLIAYPTEAIWGLGCDPNNANAVEALLQVKQRSIKKSLILVAANINQFEPLLNSLSIAEKNTLQKSWPGPNTWLIPCAENTVPYWISGGRKTVALRVSAHPVIQALCSAFGGPIVSTSANISQRPAANSVFDIQKIFSKPNTAEPVFIVPGVLGKENKPTAIRDLKSGKILR